MTLEQDFLGIVDAALMPPTAPRDGPVRVADFFCGIGGFHAAARNLGMAIVFACDIDDDARRAYRLNFGLEPAGDIKEIAASTVPDHDVLVAGFPCQPFSIIGDRGGFSDPRGELFFDLMRMLRVKRPEGVVLENVKQLSTADGGRVLGRIYDDLAGLGYHVEHRILNALDFGLPQKRERTIITATLRREAFPWPTGTVPMRPLADLLEPDPDPSYRASERIRRKRKAAHTATLRPAIWHENKGGNISSHPWSCALRAGGSYNYLLVDGERRLTPRELLRLQGFPEDFEVVCTPYQTRKQAGNAVPVPMVQAVLAGMEAVLDRAEAARKLAGEPGAVPVRAHPGRPDHADQPPVRAPDGDRLG